TSGASTLRLLERHENLLARDEVSVDGVDLRAALGADGDRQAHVCRLLTRDFGDRVGLAVVLLDDRDDGRAELGVVAAEHLDRKLGRKLQQRLVDAAHSQRKPSSSRMRAQTPPSWTFWSTMSGLLTSGAPSKEMLTSPTVVPRASGAASSASTSMLAASCG